MKIIREPSVYLTGKQVINDSDLNKFLEDYGITWETDTEIASEELVETAGRTCYMSFAKPRPGGNKAYIGHILEVGHGSVLEHAVWNFIITGVSRSFTHELVRHRAGFGYCLAGDTVIYRGGNVFDGHGKRTIKEIYDKTKTHRGRSRIKLMKVRSLDGEIFISPRIKAVVECGVKQLFKLTLTDGKSIRCTKDHPFLSRGGWAKLKDLKQGQLLATNGMPVVNIPKDWLYQKYRVENLMLEEIAYLLNCSASCVAKYIGKYGFSKPKGKGMLGRNHKEESRKLMTNKKMGHYVSDATKKKLSDSKKGEKNHRWQGDDASEGAGRQRAQSIYPAEPCEVCGNENGHRHHKDRNPLNNNRSNIEFLCVSCHTKRHIEEDGHPNLIKVKWVPIKSIEKDIIEMTYDLEINHPSHNYVASGFVTHNSQLSQRYVDESVAEYVEPDIIANDPDTHNVWLQAVENSHEAYKRLVGKLSSMLQSKAYADHVSRVSSTYKMIGREILNQEEWYKTITSEEKTALRKEARQASRSVLPNATETKIFVTANARSLRHFIEMRASRHAEPEIRKVAIKILKILQVEAPNLFGDYSLVNLPDGTQEAQTQFRKV